ncbi:FecR domain-containing protein [Pseudomonas sp. CDFA 602]|uniref:FecR domain-containing protein n=1 Tax=Pseudomonas californiensis TaxID=2829823 RepID=UPI001E2F4DBB|nr:FecR domain-containing protein [Pseudomonas californiensis]MCD5996995.1 FecR domain-containing protein [Pseudomonas californiensis]MCD6002568.1 FecR domain-containing protein [Pseudomonas californiensis]
MAMQPDRKVFETAAYWYVQFQSEAPTPSQQRAWSSWLNSDPAHQMAWNQMEQLQRSIGGMPKDLTRRALSDTQRRRQMLKLLALLPVLGYAGWSVQRNTSIGNVWADYHTRTGQRRHIELVDGTQLDLNTDTAVDVQFDPQQRLVRLRAGEILIRTGKQGDPRPFFVESHEGRVQALGTCFSVRQQTGRTHVGVLEDQVSIQPDRAVDKYSVLNAGQSADFDIHHVGTIGSFRQTQVAWSAGQLIVLDARLGDVVDELARYRPGIMQCDERAADLRVSGTFRLDSMDSVLVNLQASLPIRVHYFTRYWVSVRHSG